MSSCKGRGRHRHTSQMTDSPSLSQHTPECTFLATKHSPTGEELKNTVKSPTARRVLEVKALKFFVETLFSYPDDPSLPLVQINALNDIKKLHDDELINITADENEHQLFTWGIDKCTAQDGWLTQSPLIPNIDDDDDQTFPKEVKHDEEEPTTDNNVENHQLDKDDQQHPVQDTQNDEDDSFKNVNHDADYRYDECTQKPQGVEEITFCGEIIHDTTHTDDDIHIHDVQKLVDETYFIDGEKHFIVPGQFDDAPEEEDNTNYETIKLLVGDKDNHKSDEDDDDDDDFTFSTNFKVDEYDGDDTITEITEITEIKRLQHLLQEATTQQSMMEYFNVEMTERIMMLENLVHEKDELISTLTTGRRSLDDVQAGVHQHLNPPVTVDQPVVPHLFPPESITYDLLCTAQPASHAIAVPHPEERLQDDRAQLDPTTSHPSLAYFEKRTHDNHIQPPDSSPPALIREYEERFTSLSIGSPCYSSFPREALTR